MLRLPRGRRRSGAASAPGSWGTVILPFGRYFAGRADLLTRERFKTILPIDGVSPFSGVGAPDPELQHLADADRVNDRARTEVRKDLAARLAQADADVLVVDNSAALLWHREVNGRLYTVIAREQTDLMDLLWHGDEAAARALALKLSQQGLTDSLRATYDGFVSACLGSFDPARIVLVRSHAARFWIGEDGTLAPTNVDRRDARFLELLDDYFVAQTGCRVAASALACFPSTPQWHAFDHRMRRAIEQELVELCASPSRGGRPAPGRPPIPRRGVGAADHVVGALRAGRAVDWAFLQKHFDAGGASYDDLLALACLDQRQLAEDDEPIRACVQRAVADPASRPASDTRRRFDRSLRALRGWRRRRPRLPLGDLWTPQITVPGSTVVVRFLADGSVQRIPLSRVPSSAVDAVAEGRLPLTPHNLADALGSWPLYLARARRGVTAAPRVVVADVDELVGTCAWLDWAQVLDDENVVISTRGSTPGRRPAPEAKTDLSFVLDASTRVCTVGGGLMDQITHIALFDDLCRPLGLDYVLDDLRYTWWRSHNGFEATRLAPDLQRRRLTSRLSQPLIESFREEVTKTRLPWVFNQSRAWHAFGLQDATVVTRDYVNARRLVEMGPEFAVHVYDRDDELGRLLERPPSPVCFYTTQHRIPIAPQSAAAIRRVFSYHHLGACLPPEVARVAALLRRTPHVAVHVRRGDYLQPHFDTGGWHSQMSHYVEAMGLVGSELGRSDVDVAVFSDDLEFVEAHLSDYGLDQVRGHVRLIRGNTHYSSIFDSYLMSLCPVIVGSVGFFAATTSLLADPPSVFIRARPGDVRVQWRR